MLYLQSAESSDDACAPRTRLTAASAAGLERALLAEEPELRIRELRSTLADDPALTACILQMAQWGMANPPSLVAATDWLAGRLASLLAATLVASYGDGDRSSDSAPDIEARLPSLARRLAQYERQISEFDTRLEREKLESLKELAYGASHEINNPLANIAARAQTLLDDEPDPERQRKLAAIHRQAMRAHEMIADLMLFARPPKLVLAACDLGQIAGQIVDELQDWAREQQATLTCHQSESPLLVRADSTQIAVAVQALVRNALEAVGNGGQVEVHLRRADDSGTRWAEVEVRDDGPGIPDDIREHVFDPFFSGREAGRGLGFGLSKCWRIVTDHGGAVVVEQPAGGGAAISIRLPLAGDAAAF